MSPFDMFVLITFMIAAVKAAVDSVNFWRESEELAQAHFQSVDAANRIKARRALQQNTNKRPTHNSISPKVAPKHLPVPVRPARVPAGRNAGASAMNPVVNPYTNKSRAIRTGLGNNNKPARVA